MENKSRCEKKKKGKIFQKSNIYQSLNPWTIQELLSRETRHFLKKKQANLLVQISSKKKNEEINFSTRKRISSSTNSEDKGRINNLIFKSVSNLLKV